MPGSVRYASQWFRLPDGVPVTVDEVTPGDCIRLRGLARIEFLEFCKLIPDGLSADTAISELPSDALRFILDNGIVEWTFLDDEGGALPYSEKAYVDAQTFDFSVVEIVNRSRLTPGEASSSVRSPKPARSRRSSQSLTIS